MVFPERALLFFFPELLSFCGLISASPFLVGSSVVIAIGFGLTLGMAEASGETLGLRTGLASVKGVAEAPGVTEAAGVGAAVTEGV